MQDDDDILDFDFVDDETREIPPPRRSTTGGDEQPGETGRAPGLRSGGRQVSLAPLLRLLGLVGVAIVVIVVLVVWAQGCSSDSKRSGYNDYLTQISTVGTDSAQIGVALASLLTTPGLKQEDVEQKLGGLVQRQQLDVQRAQTLDPPGPLTPAGEHAIQALQLRVRGLQGLLDAFKATATTTGSVAAGAQLAQQGKRLEASDILWQDLFRAAAEQVIAQEGIAGVTTPASVFVASEDLYSTKQMTLVHQRIHGASTGSTQPSGIHGSGLIRTRVLPAGDELSPDGEITVKASTELRFEVTVKNTGANQEVQVQVTLTIPAQPSPIVKTGSIDIIDPGEEKTVVFKDFPEVPFGEKTTIQVNVKPVPGEQNTTNNSREYPVVFSL